MTRNTSPRDWCSAGLTILRDEGLEALTVDRLCMAVGRTKGSFYHHFRELDSYLSALLTHWEEELTEALIRDSAPEPDTFQREVRIEGLARLLDHQLDRAVRAWAMRDARARVAMERVDKRRIAFIAEIFQERGYRDPHLLAELKYMAFVGAQQIGVFESPARAARLTETLRSALAWLGNQEG
ncbi:TetR/AcrR family transcriptional regulator [Megalodesulfovibrio gigas]|uniref:Putative TetR family transcriptional regulator n=1 Tax=Megalodesulfovibrio gigas (strain ATCC 19364 / DSM 1382 / NCIMB 9332 / VKM B-1759) TaxID=1121448 RepID=T2GC41_MEGG1|nr:TetR/AcrR family transcriptional regulator [Megalodesulfovibrio gigas]AGW13482.1 putative TetR family transcriptional regulator [Megalodesulfovibrio gigas DSM 1382 = ATCC 19364]